MSKVIEQLQNRRSVRNFLDEKVKDEDLEVILRTAQRAPSSVNGQQISLMVVKEKDRIKQISEICNQEHIADAGVFVMILVDFYRGRYAAKTLGKRNIAATSAEGILVGAVDAGIMLSAIQTAAEGLGYGTTAIGAVRSNPEIFIKMFDLPEGVFPILGTTIGVPAQNPHKSLKPRVPLESFVFYDKYDQKKVEEGVEVHEVEMKKWREAEGTDFLPTYKEMIVRVYENLRYDTIRKQLEKQGFKFTDNPDEV